MTESQIYAGLEELMQDVFDDESIAIGPATTADEVPGWDSQAHVMLIVATEQRFGIRFNTAELDGLHNVGDLAGLIAAKLDGGG
jgi:acyl carrier protein